IYHPLNSTPKATASFDQNRWSLLTFSITRAIASIKKKDLVLWGCLLTSFSTTPRPDPH
ncbi:hypothetical protein ACTXT7_001564, partial [Hymenolepis weldensis]